MTRVNGTLKDKGHRGRKAVGYTVLVLLFIPIVLCEGGRWLGENVLYPTTSKLHRWMRPCLYRRADPDQTVWDYLDTIEPGP